MARSDAEIEHLWRAYQAAGDFDTNPIEKDIMDLFEGDFLPIEEIPFDRWVSLSLQSLKVECFDDIPTITDDEACALYFMNDMNRLAEPSGKMQRNDVAAALFNNQLALDKKRGHRMLEKPIKGGALLMALRRANKL